MRIFGGLKDCECGCDLPKKPTTGGPLTDGRENLVSGQCCGGELDDCCTEEEDEPAKQSLWSRYLERLKKATGGQSPKCH